MTGSEGLEKVKVTLHCYAMQLYVNITNTTLVNAFSINIIVSWSTKYCLDIIVRFLSSLQLQLMLGLLLALPVLVRYNN